jgi:hypothetical protein
MPSRYVHLVNADVDEKLFEMYGISNKKGEEKPNLPKKCLICEVHNSPESEICYKCGRLLDLEIALKLEEKFKEQSLNANKTALKLLLQMLQTGQIPQASKDELENLIHEMNA